jgi:hypothetical protein
MFIDFDEVNKSHKEINKAAYYEKTFLNSFIENVTIQLQNKVTNSCILVNSSCDIDEGFFDAADITLSYYGTNNTVVSKNLNKSIGKIPFILYENINDLIYEVAKDFQFNNKASFINKKYYIR